MLMTNSEISALRARLNLGQPEFGNLFGVHPMTVSKWERGLHQPNAYQQVLMSEFSKAAKDKKVRETLGAVLIGAGIAAALLLLLQHARK